MASATWRPGTLCSRMARGVLRWMAFRIRHSMSAGWIEQRMLAAWRCKGGEDGGCGAVCKGGWEEKARMMDSERDENERGRIGGIA